MKTEIKKGRQFNEDFYYYIIERPNHSTIFSNNYKKRKTAETKLAQRIKKLTLTK